MPMKLGINGLGRIAKLTSGIMWSGNIFPNWWSTSAGKWARVSSDIAHFIEKDSTYGALHNYLYGCRAQRVIEELDEKTAACWINGVKMTFLRKHRNPAEIGWRDHGVELVVDATGAFLDPTVPADDPKGSLRGHLVAGAHKVVLSAPFKIKDKSKEMPADAVTTVMGINDADYDPKSHVLVSHASCTTTCLAYMVKPLLDYFGTRTHSFGLHDHRACGHQHPAGAGSGPQGQSH